MDYAYLATNVYHDHAEDKLLGMRPAVIDSYGLLGSHIKNGKKGWAQLDFPDLHFSSNTGLHIEFYVKIYNRKIQHVMVAFRGTNGWMDWLEDANTWGPSVLRHKNTKLGSFTYWQSAQLVLANFKKVLLQLDQRDLMAHGWEYHITGHSLGAALANMMVGTGYIAIPPRSQMKAKVCSTPKVISFNPPGIRSLAAICDSPYLEGQVISMRAVYDAVSAVGEPYGYVINNVIPEGYHVAQEAFELKAQGHYRYETKADGEAVADQHLMKYFLKVIARHTSSLTCTHTQLAHWANTHGGLNHDEKAKPLFGLAA
jgi:hypothetical protein